MRLAGPPLGKDRFLQRRQQRLLHRRDHIGPRQVAECDARVRPFGDAVEVDGDPHGQIERLAFEELAHDALDRRLVVKAGAHLAQHGHGHGHFDDVVEVAIGRHLRDHKHLAVGLGRGQRLFQVGVDLGVRDVLHPWQARRKLRHALQVERLAPVGHHLAHALESHQAHASGLALGQIRLLQDGHVLAAVLDLVRGLEIHDVVDLVDDAAEGRVLDDVQLFLLHGGAAVLVEDPADASCANRGPASAR